LQAARRDPSTLHVGLDPVAEKVADSARAARREGIENLLFVVGALEGPPDELAGLADKITVLFPWGSLLAALALGDAGRLENLARLARAGAELDVLFNDSVFDDAPLCARLGLEDSLLRRPDALGSAYARVGIDVTCVENVAPPLPYVTTWGQKLTVSGRRAVLRLRARIRGDAHTVL
jgi:hypothetical protein